MLLKNLCLPLPVWESAFIHHSPGKTKGLKGALSSSPSSCSSSSSSSSFNCAPPLVSPPVSLPLSPSPSSGCESPSAVFPFSLPHAPLAPKTSSPDAPPSSGPTLARISLCLCEWGEKQGWNQRKRKKRMKKDKTKWYQENCSELMAMTSSDSR